MNKHFTTREIIFPFIVLLMCFISLGNKLTNPLTLSNLNSLIGIIGVVLFFYRHSLSSKLIYFWIISQIVIIKPFFDLSQFITFTFGVNGDNFELYFNLVPIALLGYMKIVHLSNLVGKRITFYEFRETVLGNVFPLTGLVQNTLSLETGKDYLLIKLDDPFLYENNTVSHVLTKAKDSEKTIKLGGKQQIAYFKLVLNEEDLKYKISNSFPFIDWVKVN